ncbi:zinc ribbon domain-containing protein [Paraburkholderia terrae]|uniref:zinc ribbon domain-containing protein n=1 Tax=Paraburkholderia terrae TaxID=311230 RepID=UPI003A5C6E4D
MAKSEFDAGWSVFRTMLQYKGDCAGVWFEEADKRYSTQTCSCCDRRTGPKGREGRGIWEWACLECSAYHHREANAAVNILAAGRRRLAQGISARQPRSDGWEDVKSRRVHYASSPQLTSRNLPSSNLDN